MDGSSGEGFYNLLKELGFIANVRSAKALDIWAEHVAKAHKILIHWSLKL